MRKPKSRNDGFHEGSQKNHRYKLKGENIEDRYKIEENHSSYNKPFKSWDLNSLRVVFVFMLKLRFIVKLVYKMIGGWALAPVGRW